MRSPSLSAVTLLTAVVGVAVLPSRGVAQEDAVASYYRGVADHFGLPPSELRVLAEWRLQAEEVPVVLFLARHAGISADALVALKRGGRSWAELAERYDVGPGAFHVPLQASSPPGTLASAYEQFRSTPSGGWDRIRLDDGDVVQLVNLKFVTEYVGAPADRVLQLRQREGSYVAAYGALMRSGG